MNSCRCLSSSPARSISTPELLSKCILILTHARHPTTRQTTLFQPRERPIMSKLAGSSRTSWRQSFSRIASGSKSAMITFSIWHTCRKSYLGPITTVISVVVANRSHRIGPLWPTHRSKRSDHRSQTPNSQTISTGTYRRIQMNKLKWHSQISKVPACLGSSQIKNQALNNSNSNLKNRELGTPMSDSCSTRNQVITLPLSD